MTDSFATQVYYRAHERDLDVACDLVTAIATPEHVKVLDGHDAKFKTGYIGLQHLRHNMIEFRQHRVREHARSNLHAREGDEKASAS